MLTPFQESYYALEKEVLRLHQARDAAIEECARVADEMHNHYGDAIAAAIRALKERQP